MQDNYQGHGPGEEAKQSKEGFQVSFVCFSHTDSKKPICRNFNLGKCKFAENHASGANMGFMCAGSRAATSPKRAFTLDNQMSLSTDLVMLQMEAMWKTEVLTESNMMNFLSQADLNSKKDKLPDSKSIF